MGELSEIPKRGWNRKEGRGSKDFKKGASCVKGWVLLTGGAGTSLRTMHKDSHQEKKPSKYTSFSWALSGMSSLRLKLSSVQVCPATFKFGNIYQKCSQYIFQTHIFKKRGRRFRRKNEWGTLKSSRRRYLFGGAYDVLCQRRLRKINNGSRFQMLIFGL